MQVAALYDIHGNLPALEAVLEEIRGAHVDEIVVGGDVLPGPMPRETIKLLLDLDLPVRFIHGNGDREVLDRISGRPTGPVPEQLEAVLRWNAQQVQAEYEQLLAGWPPTRRFAIDGLGEVLFCHATPRNDTEIFTRVTPEERLLPIFTGLDVALVIVGHTHMAFDRTIGNVRVVNAGSVGMPFGEPGADWLLLSRHVQRRHTPYNLDRAAARIRATDYPQAEDFAAHYVLDPPSEEKMLGVFAPAQLM